MELTRRWKENEISFQQWRESGGAQMNHIVIYYILSTFDWNCSATPLSRSPLPSLSLLFSCHFIRIYSLCSRLDEWVDGVSPRMYNKIELKNELDRALINWRLAKRRTKCVSASSATLLRVVLRWVLSWAYFTFYFSWSSHHDCCRRPYRVLHSLRANCVLHEQLDEQTKWRWHFMEIQTDIYSRSRSRSRSLSQSRWQQRSARKQFRVYLFGMLGH